MSKRHDSINQINLSKLYCDNRVKSNNKYVTTFLLIDYDKIPRDLILLEFIPESKAVLIKDSGIVEVLADIYGACTEGGGTSVIDVNKVITQL